MPICPACGQENPEGFRFCGSCGNPVGGETRRQREERKVVTVLFADLVGFTGRAEQLDPEDVRGMLSPYYARLRSELERRGGTVEKFIGDAVMAVFGAPVAHEDDPERAVRAALAIRDAIRDEEAGLQVRIAVNTGEALVSLDARPSAGEGMAAGDVVNTTARLQSAAAVNGILVGESTYRATRHAIEYREAAPVEAKGKVDPLQVWEAVQAYSRIAVETLETGAPLIGRRRELDVLTGALERARQERTPQLVTLVGVPGIGKSRLVYELFKAIESEPDLVFWRQGRALPYGEGVTYWALAEMVKAHAGVLETDSLVDVGQKLTQAVSVVLGDSPEAEWVELHLRLLVGLTTSSDMSGDRRAESFAAWRRFFEALAEQNPLVLIFDDLHWADDNLLDFVDHLVDWASSVPILVVCAARPELLDRRPAWGGGKLNAATVSVTPLSDEETAELIGALLERILLPAEIQATLLAHAGGNPLYAEQFVRMHLERAGDAPALPETVQGIIAARLDILPGGGEGASPGCRGDGKSLLARRRCRDRRAPTPMPSRRSCTRSSARTSSAENDAPPSPARPSTRSDTCWCRTLRTPRFPGLRERRSTALPLAGSIRSRTTGPTIGRRCLRTTTSRRSSSPAQPVARPAIFASEPALPCVSPRSALWR